MQGYSISKQTSHPTPPKLNILPLPSPSTYGCAAFCNEIYLFSRLSIWRFISSDYDQRPTLPHPHFGVAIAKEPLKLCRCPMLLHSDENDKRLLNRQHRPTSSSLPQQVYSWKIIRIRIRIRFGNWCTQHAEKVNSYVLFKVRFTLQIEHSERKALTVQTKLLC